MRIPETGIPRDELLKKLEAFGSDDLDTRSGGIWAYIYDSGRAEVDEVAKKAYMMYLHPNGLDPTVFPSVARMENEIMSMAAAHLGGDDQVVGTFTSGGTESIILAVKTARDYGRDKQGITEPEMVLPVTAHAAFHKAGKYLGVKAVPTPVDPQSYKADVRAMRAAITPNTVLLVGSAVSYAHGITDPIPELGKLAIEQELLLHVDGCIGAFLLPYYKRLGAKITDFDFSVEGVTSISMDFHKYAYCPKGASVVMYKNRELRRYQIFAFADWPGYTVVNTSVQSSKTAGPIAAAWATLNFIGDDGYLDIARKTRESTEKIADAIEKMDDLRLMTRPESCLVAFTSDTVNVFHVIDEMNLRGWYLQAQLAYPGSQQNIHLSVMAASLARTDEMLKDLQECVEIAKTLPPSQFEDMAGGLADMDPDELTGDTLTQMLEMVGIQGTNLPERMADINGLLNALPAKLRERVFIEFLNLLFVPDK